MVDKINAHSSLVEDADRIIHKGILLVMCILICVFVSSVAAGEMQSSGDGSVRIPVVNETITTTTHISQDLPVISTPPNMAPVNPAYLRYLQQQQQATGKLSSVTSIASEPQKPVSSHATGIIPLYEDISHLRGPFVVEDTMSSTFGGFSILDDGGLPFVYDLRTMGRVSPVKNQGSSGSCWAFATVASLESTLLPGEVWDFSENNMKNLLSDLYPEGFDRNYTGGGTHKMSTAYLTRWTGPVNQSDDPYNPTSPYSPTNKTLQKHVQNVFFIPDRVNSTDNNNIKIAVQNYGAVYTTYNVSDEIPEYWNNITKSYYYFGPDELNHAVAIVGWDDNWSRNNFNTTPPGDGAFIIKNSWGSTWGDGGYFYCSYYDKLIGKDNALFTSEPPTNYNHIYQYDPFGWVTSMYTASEKVGWAANVFNSTRHENLSAVSFYTTDTNANFEVWVYWNPNSGAVLNSSGAAFTQTGTFANAGYHTIPIPREIPLDSNDRFAVAIKLTNPSYNWSIALQDRTEETSKATAYPGQGYTSGDGTAWSDITDGVGYKNSSICIKAFTRETIPVANFTGAPTTGMAPLNVSFTDSSTGTPTSWNWSFGDGSLVNSTMQNPVHTYASAGTYTVSLNATNAAGSNITVKTRYISVESATPAAMFRANPQHTGVYDDGGVRPTNTVMWSYKTNGPVYSSPAVTGGVVYIGNEDKNVYAINASTGIKIWNYTTGSRIDSSPAVSDGVVYIGSWDRNIYALNAATGAKIWNFTTEGEVRASPAVVNGVVYVGSIGNQSLYNPNATSNFYAINAATGTKIWNYSTSYEPRSSPAVANGLVYFGTFDRYLYALNASTGAEVWTFTAGEFVESSPAVVNDVVYVGSGDHNVYALNATTGDEIWHYDTGSWVESSPAVANGVVYIGSRDTRVYAFNATTGAKIWDFATGGAVTSSPAVANGIVYVGSQDKNVYALNAATGALFWSYPTESYVFSSPAVANGAVYFGSWDHNVYALGGLPPAPVANFTANVTSGIAPLSVQFTDASSNNPTGWAWFFGDETYTQPWTQQNASSGWSTRSAQSTVVMQDGTIVLMGGGYGSSNFNDTWRSTDSGVTWTLVNASSGWSTRSAHSSVAMPDGSIVLMGGSSSDSVFLNDTWKSTDKGTTWTPVNKSSGWSERNSHTSVAMPDGTIVLMGGWDGSISWNDTWKSTDEGTTWTLVNASSGWSKRSDLLSVVMPDGSIVLIWGVSDHTGMYDTWRSTDAGATWTEISATSMPERPYAGSVAMPDGSILIMGGDGPMSYNDMWRSTNFGATWTLVNADCGWSTRTRIHSVAMPDGSIVLMGGHNLNDTWRFQPAGSSLQNPSHTYTQAGIYPVALQAYNTHGYNSTQKTGYITVMGLQPSLILPSGSQPFNTTRTYMIRVANISSVGGIGFNVTFDPAVMRIKNTSVNQSVAGSDVTVFVNSTAGLLRVAIINSTGLTWTAPTGILDVIFRMTGPYGSSGEVSAINAEYTVTDDVPPFKAYNFSVTEGVITISGVRADFNLNGRIDIGDVTSVAYMAAGIIPEDLDADFDDTGRVNVADAAKIAYYYVGKIAEL